MPEISQQQSSSRKQRQSTHVSEPAAVAKEAVAIADELIAKRAFEKYEARGCEHGHDQEDWAAATEELIAEATALHGES